ncbi:MAG: hypothetical protein SFU86_19300 [Pirellulaceae bacterium]|nr:hypothetical protein [Pirellulaceae bacterium]
MIQPLPANVPVFNCVVHVAAPSGAEPQFVARVANLAGIETRGRTEREALSQAVAAFKAAVAAKHAAGEAIPWLVEPIPPLPGQFTRLIAVHL